ncbi:hypothetical protein Tco_1068254 [Tanacetum coccineum]|uniref:Uncharacterized protein n=1 Tax=Tanacetum coccineum TaxID=301880 RepID=A0ABQ5HF75_9ASTR
MNLHQHHSRRIYLQWLETASQIQREVLWIQNQLLDYGYNFMHTKIYIDNESTICIVKNPVFHSKTKHIEIRHHFIKDSNEKKLIQMIKIHTDQNVADLLTKVFDAFAAYSHHKSNIHVKYARGLCIQRRLEGMQKQLLRMEYEVKTEPITVPSSSQSKKTHRPKKAKKATEISQSSGPIPLVADEIGTGSGSGPRCQDTILWEAEAQTRFETASKQSNDPPLSRVNTLGSGKDKLKFKELMDLCTKQSDRVLNLETTKTAQAKEIASLKKRVISAAAYEVPTGDAVNTADMEVNTASVSVTTVGVSVSTVEPITTVSVNITIAKPSTLLTTTTTIIEDEDLTIAQTLMKMRSEKSKMVEQENPLKKKDQVKFDEEIAQRLQAELEEEERLAREREEDANIAKCDNVQAMMDSDYDLAARIHAQEQEELTIEEK